MPPAGTPRKEYPANVVELARRLHERRGWSAHRIRKALMTRGHSPAHNTVLAWIDPAYAAQRREDTRLAMRRRNGGGDGASPRRRRHPADRRLQRIRDLRALGVSFRSIAAIVSHDFADVDLDAEQVRGILNGTISTATTRRLLWPEGRPMVRRRGRPRLEPTR
jgi:hypothetical protein